MIETLFYKNRYVLATTDRTSGGNSDADIMLYDKPPGDVFNYLENKRNKDILTKRVEASHTSIAVARRDGEIVGTSWLLIPQKIVWHDKIAVRPGEALLFDASVDPDYRRQGIYSDLHSARVEKSLSEKADVVLTVVESANKASLKANRDLGMKLLSVNHLVKFFGVNFLSVERGGREYTTVQIDVPSIPQLKRRILDTCRV
ncbi:GNAT family N-acetyltransferase [Natronococcus jeotgali]|uniref:GNAT family N-acetyltransferase n=1 Tax=Natronococcus jeotgali TaxID=413812 RepID=UPI000A043AFB|nr:GNAT family N-acetyltransferase [Natronococcus jeotgali]